MVAQSYVAMLCTCLGNLGMARNDHLAHALMHTRSCRQCTRMNVYTLLGSCGPLTCLALRRRLLPLLAATCGVNPHVGRNGNPLADRAF